MRLFKNLFALSVLATPIFTVAEMPTMAKNTLNSVQETSKQAVVSVKDSANSAVVTKMTDLKQPIQTQMNNGKKVITSVKDSTQAVTKNSKATTKKAAKVNINTADVKTLQTLNGIGESKAKAIIDYRMQNGKIKNIKELAKVSGIGEATLEKLKGFIAF